MSEGRHTAAEDPVAITVMQLLEEPPEGIPGHLEVVCLTWHDRQRSRQRLVSDQGTVIQLMLPRGTHLRDGDLLYADAQRHIRVKAQAEPVLLIQPENPIQMGQVMHQLGNWHRPAHISPKGRSGRWPMSRCRTGWPTWGSRFSWRWLSSSPTCWPTAISLGLAEQSSSGV